MPSANSPRLTVAQRRLNCRVKPVAAACAVLMLAAGVAQAQQAGEAKEQLDTVVVTGIRRAIESSVAVKRGSDSIVEVVSAEELGKLPDASIAESLARLPGVMGQRCADGRVGKISICGLAPEFGGALLNGREIVSSNDGSAVEFDQFPAELVSSLVVYKTPDGTLIGQGLSGAVDIRTIRPLDSRGRQMVVNLRGERISTAIWSAASPARPARASASRMSISLQTTPSVSRPGLRGWMWPRSWSPTSATTTPGAPTTSSRWAGTPS